MRLSLREVENVARKVGLSKPLKLFIVIDGHPSACVSPWGIVVTSGLLLNASKEEVEAVLAHECAHVKLRHTYVVILFTIFMLA